MSTKPCWVCGKVGGFTSQRKRKDGLPFHVPFHHGGIDKLVPELGYVVGNVPPCCRKHNSSKGAKSLTTFYMSLPHMAKSPVAG